MAWRVARALLRLREEINAAYPDRDRASDGSIGNAEHARRSSDHNPWVIDARGVGVVRAIDVDAGPGYLPDEAHDEVGDRTAIVARQAGINGHPAMRNGGYVIAEGWICSASSGWAWVPYGGPNRHETHTHVSVGRAPGNYDSTRPWGFAAAPVIPAPAQPTAPKPPEDDVPAQDVWDYRIPNPETKVSIPAKDRLLDVQRDLDAVREQQAVLIDKVNRTGQAVAELTALIRSTHPTPEV